MCGSIPQLKLSLVNLSSYSLQTISILGFEFSFLVYVCATRMYAFLNIKEY